MEHVALGSDYDGATIPAPLGDVAGTPKLLEALAGAGFDSSEVAAIAWGNWRRVLGAWWRDVSRSHPASCEPPLPIGNA